jgi:hypothetical protein
MIVKVKLFKIYTLKKYLIYTALRESSAKVYSKSTSFVKKQKCKGMIISFSYLPDCAVNVKTVLNNQVEEFRVVKPGSHTGPILESAKNDMQN